MLRRALLIAGVTLLAAAAPAPAAEITIGPDGRTAPVFDYEQAVRERVYIPQPGIDQDLDGSLDWIAIEVMRPKETDSGLTVPAIVDPSPYYTTSCRGNEGECIGDPDGDGRNDKWPLFYDNYFVPRGYAYVLAEMNGTANSTGCPMHGGPGDIAGMKSVIDYLAGRVVGFDAPYGNPVSAGWSSGSAAMIGKSYDGTLANGVAATGVEGLKTIVPISAISDWYRYSRQNGIRFNTNYPGNSLAFAVTNPARQALCAPTRTAMNDQDGDETGDMNPFWDARNYLPSVGNVKASVFAVHGFQDDNVKLDHLGPWWDGLKASGVTRKLWLLRAGHTDPFDSRRAVWVDTLHRWFDHELLGVENGIMNEPQVTVEESKDVWKDYGDWPLPGSTPTPVYLRGLAADTAGALALRSGGDVDTLSFSNAAQSENALIATPEGAQLSRRVFLSTPLAADLRISGTPVMDLRAALSTTQSNLGALVVDYGDGVQTTRSGEGITTDPVASTTCWGTSTTRQYNGAVIDHGACYRTTTKPTIPVTSWRVTRGILDSANRNSLTSIDPVAIDEQTGFSWPLVPTEHVIPAGHRLGIVLMGNFTTLGVAGTTGATITVDTKASRIMLPVVGGYRALAKTRAFVPETSAPVVSGMPADIVVDAAGPDGAVVDYELPTATDDETADPEVVCDPAPGTRFPVGATTVRCTATDAYGNAATHAFIVTVVGKGSPAPVQDPPGGTTPPALDTALPVLSRLGVKRSGRTLRVTLTASEDVTLRITVTRKGGSRRTFTKHVGAGRRTLRLRVGKLRKGRYTVALRATDDAGNATTKQLRFRRR